MDETYQFTSQVFFYRITSTISQMGDIIISLFKRLSKLKDTGKIILVMGVC